MTAADDGTRVETVTPERWGDLERLFGRAGAENGCWCQYWLLGAAYHRRDRRLNRDDLASQVRDGSAGLLAYRDDVPVGWARLTPRRDLTWLMGRFSPAGLPEEECLSLACFFIARPARGTGVMRALIEAGVARAQAMRAPVEAYPIDPSVPGATRNRFAGVLAPFLEAGFVEVARLSPDRAVVRLDRPRDGEAPDVSP